MGSNSILCGALLGFVFVLLFVNPSEGGECCRYHSVFGYKRLSDKWCPVYCCYLPDLRRFDCCNDIWLRAASSDRTSFCAGWFSYTSNLWAPILIAVIGLLIILCCIFACCHFCCFIC